MVPSPFVRRAVVGIVLASCTTRVPATVASWLGWSVRVIHSVVCLFSCERPVGAMPSCKRVPWMGSDGRCNLFAALSPGRGRGGDHSRGQWWRRQGPHHHQVHDQIRAGPGAGHARTATQARCQRYRGGGSRTFAMLRRVGRLRNFLCRGPPPVTPLSLCDCTCILTA